MARAGARIASSAALGVTVALAGAGCRAERTKQEQPPDGPVKVVEETAASEPQVDAAPDAPDETAGPETPASADAETEATEDDTGPEKNVTIKKPVYTIHGIYV